LAELPGEMGLQLLDPCDKASGACVGVGKIGLQGCLGGGRAADGRFSAAAAGRVQVLQQVAVAVEEGAVDTRCAGDCRGGQRMWSSMSGWQWG
jgi:hypothetical protein